MNIIITGGKGYIGSHVFLILKDHLASSNIDIIDIDNCDITNEELLDKFFSQKQYLYVIHMAGLKSVSESLLKPLLYYDTNVQGTRNILHMMKKHSIPNIIFASSATVYKDYTCETAELEAINPYGQSKILAELEIMQSGINYAILRFFNPIGHFAGLEELMDSSNLFPRCMKSYKEGSIMNIYGNCIRDYFFVGDLARFHLILIQSEFLNLILNFGTGNGISTSQFIEHFERINNITLQKLHHPTRDGDKLVCVADISKFKQLYPDFQFTPIDRWFQIIYSEQKG